MPSFTGAFAGTGGGISVHVDIIPDPGVVQSQLMELASELEDTMKPMLAAREVAREDIQAHFDSESDPNGTRWAELDPTYAEYKESLGFPPDILVRTADMMHAATSREAFTVTPVGLWFNWDALPRDKDGAIYGKVHQIGTVEGGSSITVQFGGAQKQVDFHYGDGTGGNLPARPFVGMSDIAAASFWQIFDMWADEATSIAINPKTGIMQMRESSGQFGKKVNM